MATDFTGETAADAVIGSFAPETSPMGGVADQEHPADGEPLRDPRVVRVHPGPDDVQPRRVFDVRRKQLPDPRRGRAA